MPLTGYEHAISPTKELLLEVFVERRVKWLTEPLDTVNLIGANECGRDNVDARPASNANSTANTEKEKQIRYECIL